MSEGMVQYIMLCKLLLLVKDINEKYRWLGMDSSGEVIAYVIRPTLFKDSNFGDKSVDHEDDMWYCGILVNPLIQIQQNDTLTLDSYKTHR